MLRNNVDHTHDPTLRSWVKSANTVGTDFPIQNLPLGRFQRTSQQESPRIGIAIGDQVLDLVACDQQGLLKTLPAPLQDACMMDQLNPLMSLGAWASKTLRCHLSSLLDTHSQAWRVADHILVPMTEVELLLPAVIGDYTDFYASIAHATNVGSLFRPETPLLPNYKYVPVAYHGRSSSIVKSSTPIRRPQGQWKHPDESQPSFSSSRMLDYEVEVGCLIGSGNSRGQPIAIADAEMHIFGLCLVNDWSARDIQAWEYQPLGPFLGKSFATTISPWIVTLEALAPFRCPAYSRPSADPHPLPYLSSQENETRGGVDLTVEVYFSSQTMREAKIAPISLSQASFKHMYWTLAQMITHHSSNGCNLCPGDLLASGTVSGYQPGSQGSLLEITQRGTQSLSLPTGEQRTFLMNGDEITLHAYCQNKDSISLGFGECRGIITGIEE